MKKNFGLFNKKNLFFLIFILFTVNSTKNLSYVNSPLSTSNDNSNIILQIQPNVTDPMIDGLSFNNYVVLNKSVTSKNILWIHFSGAGGNPVDYTLFLQEAANQGYHTIGLGWESRYSLNLNCLSDPDLSCYDYIRLEIYDGINRTHKCDVSDNPANSILNRLIKILIYLDEQYPNDGWEKYLDSESYPKWSNIALSGHSFGGGQAGIISQMYSVARVVFFAAPEDWNAMQEEYANWINQSFATPSERMYGFIHTDDPFYWHNYAPQNWHKMGLSEHGTLISVDYNDPPYLNSHQLISSVLFENETLNPFYNPHGGILKDNQLNFRRDGSNRYLPVWSYLLANVTSAEDKINTSNYITYWFNLPFFLIIMTILITFYRKRIK
ncbi:MAG: BPSS1187 family protein [Candidatus Hodarchaeales archaeon]|jgi:hypothetical protein